LEKKYNPYTNRISKKIKTIIKSLCIEFPLCAGLAFGIWAAGLIITREPAP